MGKETCPTCGGELSTRWLTEEIHGGALQDYAIDYCSVCEPKERERKEHLRREAAQRLGTLVGEKITVVFRYRGWNKDSEGKIVDFDEEMPRIGILKAVDEDLNIIEFASGEKVSLHFYVKSEGFRGAIPVSLHEKRFEAIKRGEEVIFKRD